MIHNKLPVCTQEFNKSIYSQSIIHKPCDRRIAKTVFRGSPIYIEPPKLYFHKTYEIDELNTFIGNKNKRIWVVCALQRDTRKVVRFTVGARTNKTLSKVTSTLQLAEAKKIYTDKLINYKSLNSYYTKVWNKLYRTYIFNVKNAS